MAIHLMEINGKIANVVFYQMYGKNFVRSAPRKAKRTKAMKTRNKNFGIASRAAGIIRRYCGPILPFPMGRSMQSRFSGAITKWIGRREVKELVPETNITFLAEFSFTEKCRLEQRWKTRLSLLFAPGGLQLHIPAFTPKEAIMAPENTLSVMVKIMVAPTELENGIPVIPFSSQLEIPYNDTETGPFTLDLPVITIKGTFIVTACALLYNIKDGNSGNTIVSDNPDYMPAAVIEARYC